MEMVGDTIFPSLYTQLRVSMIKLSIGPGTYMIWDETSCGIFYAYSGNGHSILTVIYYLVYIYIYARKLIVIIYLINTCHFRLICQTCGTNIYTYWYESCGATSQRPRMQACFAMVYILDQWMN